MPICSTRLRQGLPAWAAATPPLPSYCDPDLTSRGLSERRAAHLQVRLDTELRDRLEEHASARCCASPPASTTSSGTASSRTSTSPAPAACSSPTTSARRSPRAATCRRSWRSVRCTSILRWATPMRASPRIAYPNWQPQRAAGPVRQRRRCDLGQAAIDYAPGTNPPLTVAVGAEYRFKLGSARCLRSRVDFEYQSRNPWLSPVQDPQYVAVLPLLPTPCPRPASLRCAAGVRSATG